LQARWDYICINYNMYRRNINIKTKRGQHTGKGLSNHESFSPSQSHKTVPLIFVCLNHLNFKFQCPFPFVLNLSSFSLKFPSFHPPNNLAQERKSPSCLMGRGADSLIIPCFEAFITNSFWFSKLMNYYVMCTLDEYKQFFGSASVLCESGSSMKSQFKSGAGFSEDLIQAFPAQDKVP
jgi:hypothetical protein